MIIDLDERFTLREALEAARRDVSSKGSICRDRAYRSRGIEQSAETRKACRYEAIALRIDEWLRELPP